jgi:quercetin dioxygenase-like cupin family protein
MGVMSLQLLRFSEIPSFTMVEGIEARPIFGAQAMLNLVTFEPGSTVPAHSHPHEQLGIVLAGMQALVIDGETHELGPMEGYVIPGGVEHAAYCGPDGATVLDVFSPVREDYVARVSG